MFLIYLILPIHESRCRFAILHFVHYLVYSLMLSCFVFTQFWKFLSQLLLESSLSSLFIFIFFSGTLSKCYLIGFSPVLSYILLEFLFYIFYFFNALCYNLDKFYFLSFIFSLVQIYILFHCLFSTMSMSNLLFSLTQVLYSNACIFISRISIWLFVIFAIVSWSCLHGIYSVF